MTIEIFGYKFREADKSYKVLMAINGCELSAVSFRGSFAYVPKENVSGEFIEKNKALLDLCIQLYVAKGLELGKKVPDMKLDNYYLKFDNPTVDKLLARLHAYRNSDKKAHNNKSNYKKPVNKKGKNNKQESKRKK